MSGREDATSPSSARAVTVGEKVAARRKVLRMTQEDVALKLGIVRGTVANIENGFQNVSLTMLMDVCDALGLRVDIVEADADPPVAPMNAACARLEKVRTEIGKALGDIDKATEALVERARAAK